MRRKRMRPTALLYGAVLPSNKRVHGIAPRLLLYTATVTAIVGWITHFREHLLREKREQDWNIWRIWENINLPEVGLCAGGVLVSTTADRRARWQFGYACPGSSGRFLWHSQLWRGPISCLWCRSLCRCCLHSQSWAGARTLAVWSGPCFCSAAHAPSSSSGRSIRCNRTVVWELYSPRSREADPQHPQL